MRKLISQAAIVVVVGLGLAGCGGEPCTGGQDPQGTSCTSSATCSRNCICENGEEINAGVCTNNVCASVATACTDACAEYDFGGYTGEFCAAREL